MVFDISAQRRVFDSSKTTDQSVIFSSVRQLDVLFVTLLSYEWLSHRREGGSTKTEHEK